MVMRQYGYLATDGLEQPAHSPAIRATPNAANPQRNMFKLPAFITPACHITVLWETQQRGCRKSLQHSDLLPKSPPVGQHWGNFYEEITVSQSPGRNEINWILSSASHWMFMIFLREYQTSIV
jgi:hypothetical protein